MNESAPELVLYGYWRSSSAYRVRIALNLKGIEYRHEAVHLVRGGGEQHSEAYRRLNPMGLVPALVQGDRVIVESLAICEFLEEQFPHPPLLPAAPAARARVRSLALSIACGIQPLANLGILNYLKSRLGVDEAGVGHWYGHWVERGFSAFETWIGEGGESGAFCHGDEPGLADCFLVPQVYNAERFGCDLGPYPRIREITARCRRLDAFDAAAPENQPDAPEAA
ncbi:MAG: maleylacetoacetate isomerase [Xanthomonadales bacterium]|nr:maleylacetoacetate isomerase [Xanthomonadales bacterium]